MSDEMTTFRDETITKPHRRISPCFMTGKGCVYTEQIDREIERRRHRGEGAGFTIIPLQPNTTGFYELCLRRYVEGAYGTPQKPVCLLRADQVRRTGYVICEKICKKIQESDFVIADISVPNANVFYELGLAYGIDQKIIVVRHDNEELKFSSAVEKYLSAAGCKVYCYSGLDPLRIVQFPLSNYVWERDSYPVPKLSPTMLFFDNLSTPGYEIEENDNQPNTAMKSSVPPTDILLTFSDHVRAAVGVAIDKVIEEIDHDRESIPPEYKPLIKGLSVAQEVPKDAGFKDILERVEQSFCTIIRTGGENCNPMMYFWLGYCHARGKNVIPITITEDPGDSIDDLAFDIRALWHMTFAKKSPRDLENALKETLHQMILTDFAEWSRRRFWDEVLEKRGKVSIFTGALHNPIGREMIGDWDLRAAAELTSYFASHQYRATIESPVYQIEQVVDIQQSVQQEEYIRELEDMLRGKNCVIIASPDVNPLMEIVLGRSYGIEKEHWFGSTQDFDVTTVPNAVIAFKRKVPVEGESTTVSKVRRTFYQERTDLEKYKRGFWASFLPGREITGGFVSQTESPKKFEVHAHLAIIPNPYCVHGDQKYIIVLNGVSGPATFALTHVLTGGVSHEFVAYDTDFEPNAESEKMLRRVLKDMNRMQVGEQRTGFQYIVEVKVGAPMPSETESEVSGLIFDWRHIRRWKRVAQDTFSLREGVRGDGEGE